MNLRIVRIVYGVLFCALLITLASPHYVKTQNEAFLNLYNRADSLTSEVKRFAIKHALIGVKNTNLYTQQYSQELFNEIDSNISTLSYVILGFANETLNSNSSLAWINNFDSNFIEQIAESSMYDVFADAHWLSQFAQSIQFTTTGQSLAEQHFEQQRAFVAIIPDLEISGLMMNKKVQRVNTVLDGLDLAMHDFIISDIISTDHRVTKVTTVVSDDTSKLIAMIDRSLIDPPLPVNFSSNGSYLHSTLMVSEDSLSEGRVLGDNTVTPWWKRALYLIL